MTYSGSPEFGDLGGLPGLVDLAGLPAILAQAALLALRGSLRTVRIASKNFCLDYLNLIEKKINYLY